jgi:hypothetical protein
LSLVKKVAGTQFFDIDPIPVCYGYIKLIVLETFGDQKCYMNQVFLLADNPQTANAELAEPFGDVVEKARSTSISHEMPSRGSRGVRTPPGRGSSHLDVQKHPPNGKLIHGSGRKSMENEFQDYVIKEIRELKEELEEQKGKNRMLQSKVDNLEDVVDQKQNMIDHLTALIGTITEQLSANKQHFNQEKSQLRHDMTKLMNARFEELERNISRKGTTQKVNPVKEVQREFTLAGQSNHIYSGSKSKNSDSSLRHRQQGLADLIGQLKEAIELRVDSGLTLGSEAKPAQEHSGQRLHRFPVRKGGLVLDSVIWRRLAEYRVESGALERVNRLNYCRIDLLGHEEHQC